MYVPVYIAARLLQCHRQPLYPIKGPLFAFQVPCFFPLDFSEARAVFLVGQNHVKEVKHNDGFLLVA